MVPVRVVVVAPLFPTIRSAVAGLALEDASWIEYCYLRVWDSGLAGNRT